MPDVRGARLQNSKPSAGTYRRLCVATNRCWVNKGSLTLTSPPKRSREHQVSRTHGVQLLPTFPLTLMLTLLPLPETLTLIQPFWPVTAPPAAATQGRRKTARMPLSTENINAFGPCRNFTDKFGATLENSCIHPGYCCELCQVSYTLVTPRAVICLSEADFTRINLRQDFTRALAHDALDLIYVHERYF
jgi:hypothetical protein